MLISGIYMFIDLDNDKRYIGSAINLQNRFKNHAKLLKANKHHNPFFQNIYNKRQDRIGYKILEYVIDKNDLLRREQYWMDFYESYNREKGMNICSVAGSPLGIKHTQEARNNMSLSKKGKKLSKEHVEALRGLKASIETRFKMSEASKGKKFSEEHKRKLSECAKNRTEDHKEKLRKANIGKVVSAETRKKQSDSSPRRKLTDAQKEDLRRCNLGRKLSDDSLNKMIHTKRLKYPENKKFYDNLEKIVISIFLGEKTRKEISKEYGVKYETVKNNYKRYKRKMKL